MKIPEFAKFIIKKLKQNNKDAMLVGGFVRDFLLQKETKDIDISTTAKPNEVAKIFRDFYPRTDAKEYGTITIYKDGYSFEITTTRADIKCFGRAAEVEFSESFFEDSKRRDFTINAIYMDENEKIIDFHNSIDDLNNEQIKFIGDAKTRIQEDFLRIFRYFRFSSYLKVEVSDEYKDVISSNAKHCLTLSKERIRIELEKILKSDNYKYYLSKMNDFDVLGLFFEFNDNFLQKKDTAELNYILKIMSSCKNISVLQKNLNLTRKESKFIDFIAQNPHILTITKLEHKDLYLFVKNNEFFLAASLLNENINQEQLSDFYNINIPKTGDFIEKYDIDPKKIGNVDKKILDILAKYEFKITEDEIFKELISQ